MAKKFNPNCPTCTKLAKKPIQIQGKPDARLAECTSCHVIWFRMDPKTDVRNQPGGHDIARLMQQHRFVRV